MDRSVLSPLCVKPAVPSGRKRWVLYPLGPEEEREAGQPGDLLWDAASDQRPRPGLPGKREQDGQWPEKQDGGQRAGGGAGRGESRAGLGLEERGFCSKCDERHK